MVRRLVGLLSAGAFVFASLISAAAASTDEADRAGLAPVKELSPELKVKIDAVTVLSWLNGSNKTGFAVGNMRESEIDWFGNVFVHLDADFGEAVGAFYTTLCANVGSTISVSSPAPYSSLRTPNGYTATNTIALAELFYEKGWKLSGDALLVTVRVGAMKEGRFLDKNAYANNENSQFLANIFVNNPVLPLEYAAGVLAEATYKLNTDVTLAGKLGLMEQRAAGIVGTDMYAYPTLYIEAEASYKLANMPGRAGLTMALDAAKNPKFANGAATGENGDDFAFGISADQKVHENIGVFARLGFRDGKVLPLTRNAPDLSVSGGAQVDGKLWGRETDTAGIAIGINNPSEDVNGTTNDKMELTGEIYYKVNLDKDGRVTLTPSIQLQTGAAGMDVSKEAFAINVRLAGSF